MAVGMVDVVGVVLLVRIASPHSIPRRRIIGPSRRKGFVLAGVTAAAAARRLRLRLRLVSPVATTLSVGWFLVLFLRSKDTARVGKAQSCKSECKDHKNAALKGSLVVDVIVIRHCLELYVEKMR